MSSMEMPFLLEACLLVNFTALYVAWHFLLDKKLFFKFLANVSFSAENLSSPSFLATLSRLHLQIFVVSSFHLAPDR